MTIIYDGDFIVGGSQNPKLSPNFRLNEFERQNGTIKVHRELVSALQILRDRFGSSLSIKSMRQRNQLGAGSVGLFAWISAADIEQLTNLAEEFRREGYFQQVEWDGDLVYVNIGNPNALRPISAADALQTAVQVTAGFETSGDPFQQVTGNFDGAGLSFGPSQVNFGTGTLVPLFRKFQRADARALRACFAIDRHYAEWQSILTAPRGEQIAWADAHSTGLKKGGFKGPWRGYLQAVGRVATFRQIMTDHAIEKYGRKLARALRWLHDEVPIVIDDLRCICALYDLCTQQGSLDKAHQEIRNQIAAEAPDDQFELVRVAVFERGKKASFAWRADCVSRRFGILNRQKTSVTIDGIRAYRRNLNFYLLRNVTIRNPEELRRL